MAALDALTLLATVSEGNISYTKQGRPFIFYTNDNRGHGGGPTISSIKIFYTKQGGPSTFHNKDNVC